VSGYLFETVHNFIPLSNHPATSQAVSIIENLEEGSLANRASAASPPPYVPISPDSETTDLSEGEPAGALTTATVADPTQCLGVLHSPAGGQTSFPTSASPNRRSAAAPPSYEEYGRVTRALSSPVMETLNDMELQTGYETPRPTVQDRLKRWWEEIRAEWRILGVFLLLIVICFLLADLDLSVHLQTMSEGKVMSYPMLKEAFDKHPSFFDFYTLPSDDESLILEMPKAFFNQTPSRPVIFSATFARGAWDDSSSLLLLHEPAEATDHVVFTFNITSDGSGIDVFREQYGVRTSSPDYAMPVELGALSLRVGTLPIVIDHHGSSDDEEGSYVVDASGLIENGFYITDVTGAEDARLRLDLSRSFPENLDITAEYLLPLDPSDPASPKVSETISFSMALLPERPLVARALDERIGFFSIGYQDVGDHRHDPNVTASHKHLADRVDTKVKIINRRRLSSGANESAITYYIDPTVPKQWRESFRQGVEAWRPAFQAAGFGPAAIRAILPNESGWPDDYQVGDLRYSTISWVVDMDTTFALGPSVVDPRSGEILKSDIIFTHGWVKHWISYMEMMDSSKNPAQSATGLDALDPAREAADLQRLLGVDHGGQREHSHEHKHGHDHGNDHDPVRTLAGRPWTRMHPSRRTTLRHAHRHGRCQEARAKYDLSPKLALLARELAGKDALVSDDILHAGIREVIMHEVGHTLGLRHNFKASSGVTWEQTQDVEYTQKHGLSTSVMDYLPMNLVSGRAAETNVDYFSSTIGIYDVAAIKYGYTELPDEAPGMPHKVLTALADQNLLFGTDEDDASPLGADPYVNVFDFTSDPAAFYLDRLTLVVELRENLLDRVVLEGDEFTRYAAAETTLLKVVLSAAKSLTKFIGGYTVNRARRAAPGVAQAPPLAVLSPSEQQRALAGVLQVLTDDESIIFPQAEAVQWMLNKGGECSGLYQYCLARSPVDVVKAIDDGRISLLTHLFAIPRLERLRTAEWVTSASGEAEKSFGVADLFTQTTLALYGAEPGVSARAAESRNWNLQIYWVERLLELASAPPEDLSREVAALAAAQLFSIQESMEVALGPDGTVTKDSKAYPLLRIVLVKLREKSYVKGDS